MNLAGALTMYVTTMVALCGCAVDTSSPAAHDDTIASSCSVADFGAQKQSLCTGAQCRPLSEPQEIAEIRRGVFSEIVGVSVNDGFAGWLAVDFDRGRAIKIDRTAGGLYGFAKSDVAETASDYFREGAQWVDIVSIQEVRKEELDALACSANRLWVGEGRDLVPVTDIYNTLILRDRSSQKLFGGLGLLSGTSGVYAASLSKIFSEHASREMEKVRAHILKFGASGFIKSIGDRIFFAKNDSVLTKESRYQLDRWIFFLEKNYEDRLVIEGHADDDGSVEQNRSLSEIRAQNVRTYLVAHGIDASRLDIIGYGNRRPAVLSEKEEAKSQNRRVVGVPQHISNK